MRLPTLFEALQMGQKQNGMQGLEPFEFYIFSLKHKGFIRYFELLNSPLVGSFHVGFHHHRTTLFTVFNQCEHHQRGTLNFLSGLRWNAQTKFGKVTDRLTIQTSCPSCLRPNQSAYQRCCKAEPKASLLSPFYRCFRGLLSVYRIDRFLRILPYTAVYRLVYIAVYICIRL